MRLVTVTSLVNSEGYEACHRHFVGGIKRVWILSTSPRWWRQEGMDTVDVTSEVASSV